MAEIRLRKSTFHRSGFSAETLCSHMVMAGRISGFSITERRVGTGTSVVIELADVAEAAVFLRKVEAELFEARDGENGSFGVGPALADVHLQLKRLETRSDSTHTAR